MPRIVLERFPYATTEMYKDGRWTLCLSPNRLTFMEWSASEREVWIDYAIHLSSSTFWTGGRSIMLCDAQNGDSEFFCNLPKGHAADHQSVSLSGNGGSVGWSNRR